MEQTELTPSDIYLREEVVFAPAKCYLIRAQSGRGKTSLLSFLYGERDSYEGTITYDGAVHPKDLFAYRRHKLSYLFQDLRLFPSLTAKENIQLKNRLTGYFSSQQISELLARVGLAHKQDTPVATLSLGQRQRVAFLRALAQPFEVLLLDEPFSHLDEANTHVLCQILEEECTQRGATLLMTALETNTLLNYDQILQL
ncbi:ATP-binding cassette domain-containing protein [uncultured Capnocytophaga sp.]|uniref:ABC transporter ATP-binding protein n=1 Tax=uncultured Capnocytophaga sp. TaxID=159273 RepID=UPI00261185D7|nr:ATP-binding cassette domain-containing protein [uncultured Capnocytophaga sp.]